MKKQIIKNLATNYFGNILGMALGFLIVPFLIKKLGREAFGVTVLAESIIAFSQIFAFSVRIALSRYCTIALSQNNLIGFNEYLSTGRHILFISAGLALIPGLIISYFFPSFFSVPAELANQSRVLFFLIAIAFTITIPNIVYWAVLYANQRFDLINISNFGGTILRFILIFVLFSLLPNHCVNLVSYGCIYLAMTWGQNFLVYLWHKWLMPGLKIKTELSIPKIKEIISYSGYASLGNLSLMLYENVMNIVVNLLWGSTSNAIYSIGLRIPNILKRLFLEPSWSLIPSLTDFVGRGEQKKVEALFLFYSKVVMIVILPIGFLFMLLSNQIILAWVGHDFRASAEIMPVFMGVVLMAIPASICSSVTNAYGKIKTPTRINLALSVLNILLGIIFATKLRMGLLGIAQAALIVNFCGSFIFLPIYACRVGGISFRKYSEEVIIKPLLLSLFYTTLLFFIKESLGENITFSLLASIVGVMLLNYCVAYSFLINPQEKIHIQEIKTGFINKFLLSSKII